MKKKLSIIMAICLCVCTILFVPVTDNTAYAASISLNKTAATVVNGKTVQLKVKGTSAKVRWSTSSKSIATVTTKGLVKTKKPGKVTITAKVANKTLKCKITVKKNTDDYYSTLKSFIKESGGQDEYGHYVLTAYNDESSLWLGDFTEIMTITYKPEYKNFEFEYYTEYKDYDYPSTYVSMTVVEPFRSSVYVHIEDFTFTDNFDKACFMADTGITASTYSPQNNRIYPFSVSNTYNYEIFEARRSASLDYDIAMLSWDIMLSDQLNLGMNNLGFPKF